MKNPVQLLFHFFFFTLASHGVALEKGTAPTPVDVGAILDLEKNSVVGKMSSVSLEMALEDFYTVNSNYKSKVVLHIRNSRGDVVEAASAGILGSCNVLFQGCHFKSIILHHLSGSSPAEHCPIVLSHI